MVKNWTHLNTLGRVHIKVALGYGADPEKVIEILTACVADHPGVLLPAAARRIPHRPRQQRAHLRDLLHRAEPVRSRPGQERPSPGDPAPVPRGRDRGVAAAGCPAHRDAAAGGGKALIFLDCPANLRRIHLSVTISRRYRAGTFLSILGTTDDRHADRRVCDAHRDRAGAARVLRLRERAPPPAGAPASTATSPRAGSSIRRPRSR